MQVSRHEVLTAPPHLRAAPYHSVHTLLPTAWVKSKKDSCPRQGTMTNALSSSSGGCTPAPGRRRGDMNVENADVSLMRRGDSSPRRSPRGDCAQHTPVQAWSPLALLQSHQGRIRKHCASAALLPQRPNKDACTYKQWLCATVGRQGFMLGYIHAHPASHYACSTAACMEAPYTL